MMQLLDSHPKQLLNPLSNELLVALEDIVDQIQIESNFCIRHPDYKAWELPTEAVERFGQLPASLQHKYLSLQLQHFLYGIYYNGSLKTALAPNADSDEQALHQKLENNTVLGVDLAFYERLHISNSGKGYFDPGWQVLRQESDGSLAVTKGGLTLHIKRETHLPSNNQSATVGEEVAIRLPRNLVQNGFYMAVGNAGSSNHNNHRDREPQIVRIYFNLSPEGSVAVMDSLTRQLNAISLSFSFKVLYNPSDYGRYDSGVLYFDKSDYGVIQPVVEAVYTETRSHFKAEIPLFTKFLAAGLALAEEPNHKFADQESFGTHRCQMVANGLLEARQKGDESPENRMGEIFQHFSSLGIDLTRPYLNANSEDIYTPLVQ